MNLINTIKRKTVVSSREKKLDHFYSLFHEGMTVLDVGFTNECNRNLPDTTNYFLKNYRYDRKTYTGLSIDKTDGMNLIYPECRFVSYDGGIFPFADNEFDWVFSNAVIEHVGDEHKQVQFVSEMLRVSHNVFFTTPNKFFPVEAHSNVLLLHWQDSLFFRYCTKRRLYWTNKERLNLLSKRGLKRCLEKSMAKDYKIFCNRTALMTMTFTVICSK